MKTKKFGRKLVLNKKTIVNLGSWQLSKINGGLISNPPNTCPCLPPTSPEICFNTLHDTCTNYALSYCACVN